MIQAIYRPRHNDVMLIDDDDEYYAVPIAQVPGLIDALHAAIAMPAFATRLAQSSIPEEKTLGN